MKLLILVLMLLIPASAQILVGVGGGTTSGGSVSSVNVGFDFRNGDVYVTDPSYATFMGVTTIYPTSLTVNGTALTLGWISNATVHGVDRNASVDPRLAGFVYQANDGTQSTFRVDVPTGTYSFCLSVGDSAGGGASRPNYVAVKDGATTRITMTPGGSPDGSTDSTHVRDATGASLTPTAWAAGNTCASLSVTSGTVNVVIGSPSAQSDITTLDHFRLTK